MSLRIFLFQVYVGREKEAVLDMLPFLRLGYVSDHAEMQSVISSQGPICPVSQFVHPFLVLLKFFLFHY